MTSAEVFYLLNPLSGGMGITRMLIFCDGSKNIGCCYPVYLMEGESAQEAIAVRADKYIETWVTAGDFYTKEVPTQTNP